MLNKNTIALLEEHLGTHVFDVTAIDPAANTIPYLVNKEYIVREAQYPNLQKKLVKEERLLSYLQGKVTLKIPDVHVLDVDGKLYACHKIIHGESLDARAYNTLSDAQKQLFTDDLAQFLIELHQQPIPDFLPIWSSLPTLATRCTTSTFEEAILRSTELMPFEKEYLSKFFKGYAEKFLGDRLNEERLGKGLNKGCVDAGYVLGHCDVLPKNVAYNFEAKRLNGIFDFGNSSKIHRVYEFMYLVLDWPLDVLLRVYQVYTRVHPAFSIKEVLDHALFFRICLYIGKQIGKEPSHVNDYSQNLKGMLEKHQSYTEKV